MDLSLFHRYGADSDYRIKDKLNAWSGRLDCRFLEWSGWYNQDMYQRLLGHYRLFKICKAENSIQDTIEFFSAYILQYKASHRFKYFFLQAMSVLYYLATFGKSYYPFLIANINRHLIQEQPYLLHGFLAAAEENFEKALHNTMTKITSGQFNRLENMDQTPVKGKEKGVFSKKQILIFFDLLADSKTIEKVDYTKPNKLQDIAVMLQAISGKKTEAWVEELKNCRNHGLYPFHSKGELEIHKRIYFTPFCNYIIEFNTELSSKSVVNV
jgi:hypothetical protein